MDKIIRLQKIYSEFAVGITLIGFVMIMFAVLFNLGAVHAISMLIVPFAVLGTLLLTFGLLGYPLLQSIYRAQKYDPQPIQVFSWYEMPRNKTYDVRITTFDFSGVNFLLEYGHPDFEGYEKIRVMWVDTAFVKSFPHPLKGLRITEEGGHPKLVFYTLQEM